VSSEGILRGLYFKCPSSCPSLPKTEKRKQILIERYTRRITNYARGRWGQARRKGFERGADKERYSGPPGLELGLRLTSHLIRYQLCLYLGNGYTMAHRRERSRWNV